MNQIRYTGHPFVDVGFATMTAFVGKQRVADLNAGDFQRIADYIEANYVRQPLQRFLTVALTTNAWFVQPAFNPDRPGLSPDQQANARQKRDYWAKRHLRQWAEAARALETCLFTGLPAAAFELSGKLQPGRVGRAQMPLLQGDDSINFFVNGDPGLPMAPEAILALQAMPLGCARVGNNLLAVHCDDERLTIAFANRFLQRNLSDVAKAQAAGEEKLPGSPRSLRTLLIETLADIMRQQLEGAQRTTITAYHFSNFGQSPFLELYHLPLQITGFLLAVYTPTYRNLWNELVARSWQRVTPTGKRGKAAEPAEPRVNYLYEDLFTLPAQAAQFVRTYFLRIPDVNRSTNRSTDDPRRDYSLRRDIDLVSWPLVELFVQEVMLMTDDRVAIVKELGDKLADYTRKQGGKRFFRQFFTVQRSDHFLSLLNRTNIDYTRYTQGRETLFTLDSFLTVFMEGEEVLRSDWRLMRDLVLIRMVEQLRDWIAGNPDAVPDDAEVAVSE
ncbi:MAG TPA: type I-B CRISPR-associated protein Cas8b1/Cst1 [Chloroflexus aurantiacus]|jgi:CRISPR-associated protein Cst1|uniref:CRISPR-associated CXXC_CXXC protein Cst1 n=1 Tax=Chloroflexus aurantiacus (strain ATCC 29366 / DSM 635 / J-10-fl) TaxID=324602 RepID=A9WFZ1_CHLAA|nr:MULTISPECIES: CRISPR-associated protein Cst1 [Chloroflexus]ABY36145.1 CRISPR-associated CXXC_CXXC protein Cst1 [Chloroflexus aurantiacus J-10-fl]HBW68930.1 type I-B CRISPR-associated protein Cas8b1/Cst1 [Chloroflexus aurantiacus]